MKYLVIICRIFWGNLFVFVVFVNLDLRMFFDIFFLNVKGLWYKKNVCFDIIIEGGGKCRD